MNKIKYVQNVFYIFAVDSQSCWRQNNSVRPW